MDNDKRAYRAELKSLTSWYQDDNLSQGQKNLEMIVDSRGVDTSPFALVMLTLEGPAASSSSMCTPPRIASGHYTQTMVKKACQHLHFLRRLRKFGMNASILKLLQVYHQELADHLHPCLVRELFRPRLHITADRGGSSTAHDRQTTDSQPFRMYSTRGANRRHAASRTSQLPSSKRFRSIAAPDLRTVFNTGPSEFSIQILKHSV